MKPILEDCPPAEQNTCARIAAVTGKEDTMASLAQLDEKINKIYRDIQQAVDLTIEIRAQSPENKTVAVQLWEKFLGQFFSYLRLRSKESKDNLLAGISWTRLKLF